jgi:hypothetical protein
LVLLLIFSAYFAPDMMVAITNQVWALCGWWWLWNWESFSLTQFYIDAYSP